ncbi:MAG: ABC transporter permease [Scytonema sp. PMC 1069.18]|nr:ABC transporter permease [Scytonema sp. PMC 1069.18]MEC4886031.1 ABC transporter permease [Scytonema sp. PMC 1070.18]
MINNLIDKVGDWNPQLFRELKGRLKVFHIAIACAVSLFSQIVLFLYQLTELPSENYGLTDKYCLLHSTYETQQKFLERQSNELYRQLDGYRTTTPLNSTKISELQLQLDTVRENISNLHRTFANNYCPIDQIDMQMWWRDHWEYIFLSLTVIFIFTLLVAGTYLLINNLATEERRGTLNFIRLSPQSEMSILTGKMLGVPILIYLGILTAIPLHFYAGRAANIATSHIFSFWFVLAACCIFFYSTALLFGLHCRWLSGFQPWLGSGAVLLFLMITMQITQSTPYVSHAAVWFQFFSPFEMTAYLFPNLSSYRYKWELLENVQFFYLPVGSNLVGLMGLHLLNYGLWTYWIFQGLKRCFRNPNATLLSKNQSYFLVACVQILLWGCTLQYAKSNPNYDNLNYQVSQNFVLLVFFNLILLFGLLAILSPHRQTIQDWSRYRHQKISDSQKSTTGDLIWGEKSPALVAMLINLAIATTPMVIWIALAPTLNVNHADNLDWLINKVGTLNAILSVVMFIVLMSIYTTITQLILLMKTNKRFLWAVITVGALVVLPPILLGMFYISPEKYPVLWLFSSFPWASLEYVSTPTIFMALLGEMTVLVLFNLQLTKQVKSLGESATKALLATP